MMDEKPFRKSSPKLFSKPSRIYPTPARDKVVHALSLGPKTAKQLSAETGLGLRSAVEQITYLKKVNRIHIGDWILHDRSDYASVEPVYTYGPGKHKSRPSFYPHITPLTAEKRDRCLEILMKRPVSAPQLAALAGASRNYACSILASVRSSMHICGWVKPPVRGNLSPIYQWGPGENAPRPPPIKVKVVQERFRKNNREKIKEQHKAHDARKKRKAQIFKNCFSQLIGADKPRKPMKDFATPEPEDHDHD